MTTPARELLRFALLQASAEAYLDLTQSFFGGRPIGDVLLIGNNHPDKNPNGAGATSITGKQFDEISSTLEFVGHYPSDQTGFSASLFKSRDVLTGAEQYVLSFRSTEYAFGSFDRARGSDNGGDWARDGSPGADGEVNAHGFAFAQIDSMEAVWAHLQ